MVLDWDRSHGGKLRRRKAFCAESMLLLQPRFWAVFCTFAKLLVVTRGWVWIVEGMHDPDLPPSCPASCLRVNDGSEVGTLINNSVGLASCRGTSNGNEQWQYEENTRTVTIIQQGALGDNTTLCLTLINESVPVTVTTCDGVPSQMWIFDSSNGTFESMHLRDFYLSATAEITSIREVSTPNNYKLTSLWQAVHVVTKKDIAQSFRSSWQFSLVDHSVLNNFPQEFVSAEENTNIARNGGFEDCNYVTQDKYDEFDSTFLFAICNWTITFGYVQLYNAHNSLAIIPAEGQFSLHLNPDSVGQPSGAIKQTLTTIPGQEYLLTFALGGNPFCGNRIITLSVSISCSSFGTQSYTINASGYSLPDVGWASQPNRYFTSNCSRVDLAFQSTTEGGCGPVIDNILVTAVPPFRQGLTVPATGSVPSPSTNGARHTSSHTMGLVAGISASSGLSVGIFAIVFFQFAQRKIVKAARTRKHENSSGGDEIKHMINQLRVHTLEEIRQATNNYETVLGEGAYGHVYLASLEDGSLRAVKKDTVARAGLNEEQFLQEVLVLSRLHHRQLVNLTGYCTEQGILFLLTTQSKVCMVFEYMEGGSLSDRLHEVEYVLNGSPLPWDKRMRIALQIVLGLEYLHHGADPPIIHRDIKSANILLSSNAEVAKIADFGVSKSSKLVKQKTAVTTTHVRGSLGYLDPQYARTTILTEKSDVYSFGVVLLELVTGRKAFEDMTLLTEWVDDFIKDEGDCLHLMVDPRLQGRFVYEEVDAVVEMARACVRFERHERPSIQEISRLMIDKLRCSISLVEEKGGEQGVFCVRV